MGYSLGVDLGTTFVAAAIASKTRIEMFTLSDRSVVAPATVYAREDGTLVSGEAANLRAVSSPDRVSREFKRRLGSPTPVILGGQSHSVTALLGALLRDVVAKVEKNEGAPPERVVLTHPANWGPYRRGLFDEVPQHAGLGSTIMVTEPEAAAAHYAANRQLADGDTVAVYDLGGGTFDVTVLRKRPNGVEILGTPGGIERLGGVDFDEAILSFVDYAADGALGELDLRDPQATVALARLRQDCILAKEALSVDDETVVPVFLPGRHFDVRITRSQFEDMVRALIESTIETLLRTVESAQVEPGDLRAVLLVGGSSRIPLVARMVSAELNCPTVVDAHPKYAVALGAAELAAEAARSSVLPVGASLGVSQRQRDTQPPASEVTSTASIPAQRAPQYETVAAPVGETHVGGAARQNTTPHLSSAEPPRLPTQPSPPSGPSPDNGHSRSPGSPASAATQTVPKPTDSGASSVTPSDFSAAPLLGAVSRRGWITIAVVLVLVLAGTITAVLSLGTGKSPSTSAQSGPSASAEPIIGPEVPIPALGPTVPVGNTPVFVAVSPSGHHAYVANRDTKLITVLDTAVNQVTATIPIPAGPPQFLAFAPDGHTLYVSIYNDERTINSIDVIDTTKNTVVASIPQRARPFLPAVTRDGKRLYVPNHDIASVAVIDTGSNKVT